MWTARQLQERGHLLIRGALPAETIERLRCEVADFFARFEREPDPRHARGYERSGDMPIIRMIEAGVDMASLFDAIRRSDIARAAHEHFGESVYAFRDGSIARHYRPPYGNVCEYHQDRTLDHVRDSLTCWVPLTPCGIDAPSLEVVDRLVIDKLPTLPSRRLSPDLFGPGETIHPAVAQGDVIVFLNTTPHRSYVAPGMTGTRYSVEVRFMPHSLGTPEDGVGNLVDVTPFHQTLP